MLFVLLADGLNRLIKNAESAGLIKDLWGSSPATFINMQYADDTLIFGREDPREVIIIKCLLCWFEVWSRLKINF